MKINIHSKIEPGLNERDSPPQASVLPGIHIALGNSKRNIEKKRKRNPAIPHQKSRPELTQSLSPPPVPGLLSHIHPRNLATDSIRPAPSHSSGRAQPKQRGPQPCTLPGCSEALDSAGLHMKWLVCEVFFFFFCGLRVIVVVWDVKAEFLMRVLFFLGHVLWGGM